MNDPAEIEIDPAEETRDMVKGFAILAIATALWFPTLYIVSELIQTYLKP